MDPMQIMQMLSRTQNPESMIMQLASQNPLLNRAMLMAKGKSPQEIRTIAINLAKQQGMTEQDVDNMVRNFGFRS